MKLKPYLSMTGRQVLPKVKWSALTFSPPSLWCKPCQTKDTAPKIHLRNAFHSFRLKKIQLD
jgi:hypothetical protein